MYTLEDRNRVPLKTCNLSVTGSNWTTDVALGHFFQDLNGNYYAYLDIVGTFSVAITNDSITVAGVTFSDKGTIFNQAITSSIFSLANSTNAHATSNASTITLRASAATDIWYISGTVLLKEKPDFIE